MASREATGQAGEKLAELFLKKIGYVILQRNWRTRSGEIDLIARDGDEVVFVEVKTRASDKWGSPEMAANATKRRRLIRAAREFAARKRLEDTPMRFDVVAIILADGAEPVIEHFEDAFS